MDRFKLLLIGILFLSSCAQINPLTGGEKDEVAPKPVAKTQHPEQGETNFFGSQLTVSFNEYFVLNDPSNSIRMNPNAGLITSSVNKKSLTVGWENALMPNTTYILQLNGTIADLNEKNDTILQFVFSTGSAIDSLNVKGIVTNAFTNEPYSNATIGLYAENVDPLTTEPLYATRSDKTGAFLFSYLKAGAFQLVAFDDKNKDRIYSATEYLGFSPKNISVPTDSLISLSLFLPKSNNAKIQANILAPKSAIVFGKPITTPIRVNDQVAQEIVRFSQDSILIELPENSSTFYNIVVDQDTLVKPLTEKEKSTRFTLKSLAYKNYWKTGDTLVFDTKVRITSADTSLISLVDMKGKSIKYTLSYAKNQFFILPEKGTVNSFKIKFLQNALVSGSAKNDSLSIDFTTAIDADLSTLKLNTSVLVGNWLIQLMDNTTVVDELVKLENQSSVVFEKLIPGNYSLRCIEDVNQNNQWDPGNYETKQLSEKVVRFKLEQKLRPNWEVEETLILTE